MTPRISVITIFRDAERFLGSAVASVQAQTLDAWELLLVDDGSTDGSTALARTLAASDPQRIRYLEHPGHANLGMSASRNHGLAQARAPYIAFLDADDAYLPQRLERAAALLDANSGVDMVQTESIHWIAPRVPGEAAAELRRLRSLWPDGSVIEPPQALVAFLDLPALSVPTCDITLRREVTRGLGGFEAQFRDLCEDRVFLTKVYLARRVLVCAEFLARVRVHDTSCTHSIQLTAHRADGAYQRGIAAFRAWVCAYLRAQGTTDRALLALRARWESPATNSRARGRFMMLRAHAFAWVGRHAPAFLYHAMLRGYRAAVGAYMAWCYRRLNAAAGR